jgi:hypothetical protein
VKDSGLLVEVVVDHLLRELLLVVVVVLVDHMLVVDRDLFPHHKIQQLPMVGNLPEVAELVAAEILELLLVTEVLVVLVLLSLHILPK